MIRNNEKWHCLAINELSALLKGITWKHNGSSYYLIY